MAPTERPSKGQKPSPSSEQNAPASPSPSQPSGPSSTGPIQDAPEKRSSWYTKTWPRKAAPITQVARESISSASSLAAETAAAVKDKVTPTPSRKSSLALTLGKSSGNKALPVSATTTKDNAVPESSKMPPDEPTPGADAQKDHPNEQESRPPVEEAEAKNTAPEITAEIQDKSTGTTDRTRPTSTPRSWIGWLAGGDGVKAPANTESEDKMDGTGPLKEPPTTQEEQVPDTAEAVATKTQVGAVEAAAGQSSDAPPPATKAAQRRSWLPIWNNVAAAQSAPTIMSPPPADAEAHPPTGDEQETHRKKDEQPASKTTEPPSDAGANAQQSAAKSSAWVFWSRDKPTETRSLKDAPREGEIAIANTDSADRPRQASIDLQAQQKPRPPDALTPVKASSTKDDKRAKNKNDGKGSNASEADTSAHTTKVTGKGATATAVSPAEPKLSRPASPAPPKKVYDHHLSPSLHETLKIPENPSLFQQIARLFYTPSSPTLTHLNLVKDPPRIKNALAIGVHGYFPAALIQSVLGRPTGTSIKFADMAARSIRKYTVARNYECSVKTAALEGEGRIAERIDLLWKLLLNWIDEIRKADFVMIACHSQGVPVAIMLVAKLIHFGCIAPSARVGICAMAGVSMGPFPEFKSRWISGSAGELFEFSDPNSKVSKDYHAALDDVLRFGVRLTYVGSIDDQLVSLESSIFAPVNHPHIFRAVSIDSRVHAPNFLSHLVAFALKLRNLGVQDHGLIRELSAPLAGSLYSGEGHSRLYEDEAIYDLAIAFALETTALPGVPLTKRDIASTGGNPYILPFAMRGILEEDFVKSDLRDEATKLLQEFDEWKPTTKALKDVKFRLEGIRSKL